MLETSGGRKNLLSWLTDLMMSLSMLVIGMNSTGCSVVSETEMRAGMSEPAGGLRPPGYPHAPILLGKRTKLG